MDETQGHDLLPLTEEQFDEIAARFELRGRMCRIFRLAAVDGLSVCDIAQVESEHADGPVSYATVRALLDEARVVMWQMADKAPGLLREILDAYKNRPPSEGRTPGDVKLRDPIESVEDLKRRWKRDPWKGGA